MQSAPKCFTFPLIRIFSIMDESDCLDISGAKMGGHMAKIDFRRIRQLWMFLAVAEECHFGRAAKRLNMSQPPLTQQIKALEPSLGLTLFDRSRQGTKLSASGAAILPAVRKFAKQVAQLEQSGVLHVGAITSAMLETVPPILENFGYGILTSLYSCAKSTGPRPFHSL